jgi:glutamyl-tRNA reductase
MTQPSDPAPATRRNGLPLLLVGVDHRGAPLALRERLSYSAAESEEVLVRLLARPEIGEACLVSTCNRTELVVLPRDEEAAYRTALDLVFTARSAEIEEQGRFFVKRGAEAARHLLEVASGLESMVLGEPEILGQVKQAAAVADGVGSSGTVVRRLLRAAATAGARARSETAIGTGAVSLGYAVVELAENIFNRLAHCAVLLVGAGEISTMVARSLREHGAGNLTVANRSPERARIFQSEFPDSRLVPFDQRAEAAAAADVVVASTSAHEPVLTRADLEQALRRRSRGPLLVVDLGVPRNVDPEAGRLGALFLHNIDSLQTLIDRNLRRRREEVPRVEALIDEELRRLQLWYRGLEAEPLVARLQKRAESIRAAELERSRAHFPAETHGELERLTRSLVRKLLHHPSARLRTRDGQDDLPHLDMVRELFQLDDEDGEA